MRVNVFMKIEGFLKDYRTFINDRSFLLFLNFN